MSKQEVRTALLAEIRIQGFPIATQWGEADGIATVYVGSDERVRYDLYGSGCIEPSADPYAESVTLEQLRLPILAMLVEGCRGEEAEALLQQIVEDEQADREWSRTENLRSGEVPLRR